MVLADAEDVVSEVAMVAEGVVAMVAEDNAWISILSVIAVPPEDEANESVTLGRTESGLLVTKPVVAVAVSVAAVAASGITSGAAETVIVSIKCQISKPFCQKQYRCLRMPLVPFGLTYCT